jgi:hypothetical protein
MKHGTCQDEKRVLILSTENLLQSSFHASCKISCCFSCDIKASNWPRFPHSLYLKMTGRALLPWRDDEENSFAQKPLSCVRSSGLSMIGHRLTASKTFGTSLLLSGSFPPSSSDLDRYKECKFIFGKSGTGPYRLLDVRGGP